ncbi:hypothetical protein BsWGS_18831 [Bradybaena similaris]
MDADGSGFSFSSTTDYPKGQDTTDISWADIFLDGIHSDDPITSESGNINSDTSSLGAGIHGSTQQMNHQSQSSIMGGQLQIHIPTQLQGSLANNAVQQGGAKLCGTVTYLAPSAATQQHVNTAGQIQNMMTVGGHHQVAASMGQQQQQNNAKLVQIAPSFPVTSLGGNTLPLQTLLQSGQTLTGQTLYGGQGGSLFPAQGSVHIENPKVVNVNFGPHVIGSDSSGQQTIFQTAEGKRVLITNSQLQHMSQSISLTQPLVGTQLINTGGGNVIRASLAPGTHTIMPSAGSHSRQIVLPSGHTMIPHQTNAGAGGVAKNVVLRQLNPNMSSVIYQSSQGGQLIHSQPTLISSGSRLQVVNTGGGHGSQVQLITQPSLNQTGIGQQQGTVMNLINNSGNGNQVTGLMPGQNIFVNGQVLSIGQLGSLAVPQLQVQQNSQGSVTLADINAAQFQSTAPHLVIQQGGQQQQIVLQPKNNPSPSFTTNAVLSHRFISGLPGNKTARTPTPNASSASSTPVMTPTPSTPTPTPTPELISDFTGGKSSQGIDIFKQALDMSDIDLQSFEDDISFLDESSDCFSSITPQPTSHTPAPPSVKPVIKPIKSKSKTPKSKMKNVQPMVNVTIHNSILPMQHSTQEQNVAVNTQQKIVTANGQVYVLSGNNFVLQPSVSSANQITSQITPISSAASAATTTNRTQMSASSNYHLEGKGQLQQGLNQATFHSLSLPGHIKVEPTTIPVSMGQNSLLSFAETDSKAFIKTSPAGCADFTVVSSAPMSTSGYNAFTTVSFISSQASMSPSVADVNHMQQKHQNISTLAGTFIKHKPATAVIKQENITDFNQPVSNIQSFIQPVSNIQSFNQAVSGIQSFNQSVSHIQSLPHTAASATTPTTSFPSPTSTFSAMSSSPIAIPPAPFSALVTTTTQSHHMTIMSTSHMASNPQCSVSTTNSYQPHSSVFSDPSCLPLNTALHSQNTSPGLLHNTNTSSLPNNFTSARSIADCTLMLSLTPGEKERLESKLSQMSQKDQEEFLMHQQSLIRRSQQMQVEQQLKQQQHKQLLQLKQPQQHLSPAPEFQQQEPAQQPQNRNLQMGQRLLSPVPDQQTQLVSHAQSYSPGAKLAHCAQVNSLPELTSPSPGHLSLGLPTTVQELMEHPEQESQISLQSLSAHKATEQPQQRPHTPAAQRPHTPAAQRPHTPAAQQQQQIYSNLQQRTVLLPQTCSSTQPFGMPQIGRCLAEQQLLRDRSLAVEPDVSTPFKSLSDAMRRLVRYHTLQDHKPDEGSKAHKIWDTRYSKLCDYLVRKKRCYMRRYHKMMLYRDMCQEKQPDYIQNLLCFNEQLRTVIDSEKEEAVNNPDVYDPSKPGLYRRNGATTSFDPSSSDNASFLKRTSVESTRPDRRHTSLAVRRNQSSDSDCESEVGEYVRPSCLKRTAPDKGSTGMLKLVIKRRTIDNFIVKNSVGDVKALPRDLRPVVDVEKSDSEYEFDASAADVSHNQPVIVRRRTLSLTSRQTSFDAGSDSDSASSHTEETTGQLSEEEEREESNEEEELEEKSCSGDDNDEFADGERKTKHQYHISFGGEIDSNDVECDSDDSSSVDADALMEMDERVSEQRAPYFEVSTTGASGHSFTSVGLSTDLQAYHTKDRLSPSTGHNTSVAPDSVFKSSLPYSNSVQNSAICGDYTTCTVAESVEHQKFSFGASASSTTSGYCGSSQVSLPAEEEEEYVADSPVSSLEKEAARTGLPNSSLFTTPNKNLLATDAMFNSDDEDDVRSSARLISKFEIDNKDPQSSMIDESVRSVIDSVLNDDGDDDNHKGPQTSWAPSTHKLAPSTGHRNIFQFSTSVLLPPGHEPNLDMAVSSVLKS